MLYYFFSFFSARKGAIGQEEKNIENVWRKCRIKTYFGVQQLPQNRTEAVLFLIPILSLRFFGVILRNPPSPRIVQKGGVVLSPVSPEKHPLEITHQYFFCIFLCAI